MATTSPDGLFSPDADDPYNLTADWAASMSSVQLALLNRANHVGTTAQRNAFAAQTGALWWDTTLSQAFIYNGSAWVSITGSDTGWVDLTSYLNSGFTSTTLKGRTLNGVTYISGGVSGTFTAATGTDTTLGTLPSQFRPTNSPATGAGYLFATGAGFGTGTVRITTSGVFGVYYLSGGTRTSVTFDLSFIR